MKKLIIMFLLSGCTHYAYKPQIIKITKPHTLIIHSSVVEMENAYEYDGVKYNYEGLERGEYSGYFNGWTNIS